MQPSWLTDTAPSSFLEKLDGGAVRLDVDAGRLTFTPGGEQPTTIAEADSERLLLQLSRSRHAQTFFQRMTGRSPERLHLRVQAAGEPPLDLWSEVSPDLVEGLPWMERTGLKLPVAAAKAVATWVCANGELARWAPGDAVDPTERASHLPAPPEAEAEEEQPTADGFWKTLPPIEWGTVLFRHLPLMGVLWLPVLFCLLVLSPTVWLVESGMFRAFAFAGITIGVCVSLIRTGEPRIGELSNGGVIITVYPLTVLVFMLVTPSPLARFPEPGWFTVPAIVMLVSAFFAAIIKNLCRVQTHPHVG